LKHAEKVNQPILKERHMRKLFLTALMLGIWFAAAGQTHAGVVTITFDNLPGNNGDSFTGPYSENGFSVNATAGNWFVAKAFGNPIPDLFAGPIDSPSLSDLTITKDGGGTFSFSQSDLVSQNGDSHYTYLGFLGATPEFSNGGTIPASGSFATFANPSSATLIDRLVISIDPVGSPSSMNVDNIVLTTPTAVPEPATLTLLGLGALSLAGYAWRRKRLLLSVA
jgi:hypothetical protein